MFFFVLLISLGYGISDIVVTDGNLCGFGGTDAFSNILETVFQLKMGAESVHETDAKEWVLYDDVSSEEAVYICEKEGKLLRCLCFLEQIYMFIDVWTTASIFRTLFTR